jgi:glycosyltransferase involved in cell wall biosynthesis
VTSALPAIRVHTLIDSLSWGGAEMLLADLAASAAKAGIEMSVGYLIDAAGNPAATGLRRHNVEPVHVPVRRLLDPIGFLRLRRHLMAVRPDIVHTHLGLADVLGTPAARSLGIPSVSTIHLIANQPTGRPDDSTRRGMVRTRLAAFVRRHAAARVIAVSDAARDAYVATGWDSVPHVVTVRNGIARTVPPDPASVRTNLGLAPDDLVVTTVSVLRPGKGHDVAIEAVRRLRPHFPAMRLLIVGDGPAREEIARKAGPLGDAVVMAGHRDDVMAILAATDVVIHATSMDAFPTALLEAAAAGVPVIATEVGGIPEIVEPGGSGLLVTPPPEVEDVAAKLAELLEHAELRRRLGLRAQVLFNERFTAERWAAGLRAVYEDTRAQRVRSGRNPASTRR